MKPDQGLFQFDFDDFHAVLGVPITADAKAVRKRYLTIARKLHPDSLGGASAADARQASEILSKLVNPAYEALSQEKSAIEHMLVLKLKGQSLRRANKPPVVTFATAQALIKAPNPEQAYRQAINALAESQFDNFNALTSAIGNLSELNLVYLYRSSSQDSLLPSPEAAKLSSPSPSAPPRPASAGTTTPLAPRPAQAILESYINRAQEYEHSQEYSRAIMELREAVKSYPNASQCHSYLAALYLKAGQGTMARIHATRALQLNPSDERARLIQTRVEKMGSSTASGGTQAAGSKPAKAPNPKSSDKGGGFFGLFGGKKKS